MGHTKVNTCNCGLNLPSILVRPASCRIVISFYILTRDIDKANTNTNCFVPMKNHHFI